jgi:hypothetical protein
MIIDDVGTDDDDLLTAQENSFITRDAPTSCPATHEHKYISMYIPAYQSQSSTQLQGPIIHGADQDNKRPHHTVTMTSKAEATTNHN